MERGAAIGGMGSIAGSRRGGSGSAAGVHIWDETRYYLPTRDPTGPGDASSGSPAGIGDLLWAIPFVFDANGTITDVLVALGQLTNSGGEAFAAIYDSDLGSAQQPTDLLYSLRNIGQGFGGIWHASGNLLAVTAGHPLWFVTSGTHDPIDAFVGGCICVGVDRPGYVVGYSFNPASPTGGTGIRGIVGIKKARTYAWPPPDPFPAVASDDSDRLFNSGTDLIPTFMFRFRPSEGT